MKELGIEVFKNMRGIVIVISDMIFRLFKNNNKKKS
jgi:hypothetical protein